MNKVRQFTLLTVVAVIGLFAAGYLTLIKPKSADVRELEATKASQDSRNTQLAGQIKMLNEQAKKLPAVQAELAAIAKQLPANPELPALVRAVTAAADDAGLTVLLMAPEEPLLIGAATTTGTAAAAGSTATGTRAAAGSTTATTTTPAAAPDVLAAIPVEFKIRGGYHNMQLFFANLENLPRSFVLNKFSIVEIKSARGKFKPGDIDGTLNGRVYMAVPATSLPAARQPAAPAATATK